MGLSSENLDKLIKESMAMEIDEARKAGTLGFMARALVQATLPHKNPGEIEVWSRQNGNFSLIMQPGYCIGEDNNPQNIGLPYGTKPRLILSFVASEAVKTRNKEIVLGSSLSEFMQELNLVPTGGRWGTITALKNQVKRLFSSTISYQHNSDEIETTGGFRVASQTALFWDAKSPKQNSLWKSTVTLTQEFYDEIIESPVPVDLRALSSLKDSSLALDIYCWLTYRMSYLTNKTEISWSALAAQFGSDYTEIRDFKKNFIKQLRKVLVVYGAKVEQGKSGVILAPTSPHVLKKL